MLLHAIPQSIHLLVGDLHLLVIETNGSLRGKTVGPESIDGWAVLAVGEDKPESKDGLGQNIEDSISDDLSVDGPVTGTLSDTPYNEVENPDDQGVSSNGSVELASGRVSLGLDCSSTWDDELVGNDQESKDGVDDPSPLGGTLHGSKASHDGGECKCNMGEDDDQDIGSTDACEES